MTSHGRARVNLRCDLNGLVAERFIELKTMLGLQSNAELVRLLTMIGYLAVSYYHEQTRK